MLGVPQLVILKICVIAAVSSRGLDKQCLWLRQLLGCDLIVTVCHGSRRLGKYPIRQCREARLGEAGCLREGRHE